MGMKWMLLLLVFQLSVLVLKNTGQKMIYRIEEIARQDGYVLHTDHILTTDSYILAVHRIPYKRFKESGPDDRPIVILMHGMFSSSNSFIHLGPEDSIAYNLADAGFDVWLCNARGTKHSRFHEDLDPDSPYDKQAFFDFTYEEIGLIDLAETVDYILTMSEVGRVHYIGLGAGGTAFLVLNSIQPSYNQKFLTAHLLGAVGYQQHFNNPLLLSLAAFTNTYYKLWKSIGLVELFPPGSADNALNGYDVPKYCTGDLTYGDVCELMGLAEIMFPLRFKQRSHLPLVRARFDIHCCLAYVVNFNEDSCTCNVYQIGPLLRGESFLSNLVDSEMAGGSVKEAAHFGQNIKSRSFRRWDHGDEQNLEIYETDEPPEYDLSQITVNVTFHYSSHDHLVDERDVANMANDMPNGKIRRVPENDFQHFDYFLNPDVKSLVTDYIIRDILHHDNQLLRKYFPNLDWFNPPQRHIANFWFKH